MHVAVIGGGVVGLSTAWYLNERGIFVTIFERKEVGAGASWGNAGQIIPTMAVPLAEPSNLKFALTSFLKSNSSVTAPRIFDKNVLSFLPAFAFNSTTKKYLKSLREMMVLSTSANDEFQHLEKFGVQTTRKPGTFTAAMSYSGFGNYLLKEFSDVAENGMVSDVSLLTDQQLHRAESLVLPRFTSGIQLKNQSFLDPPQLLSNLAANLSSKGIEIIENCKISSVTKVNGKIKVSKENGSAEIFDSVVIATGGWLSDLAVQHGVKMPVVAGIGYSMSVKCAESTNGMLYFPEYKLACTPYRGGLRISSFLQIANVDRSSKKKNQEKLLQTSRKVFPQIDWDTVGDFWSGGRPLSTDGKPLIGQTKTAGVFVNGGHGMWGVTLGPVSGKLLADRIFSGHENSAISNFNPLRSSFIKSAAR